LQFGSNVIDGYLADFERQGGVIVFIVEQTHWLDAEASVSGLDAYKLTASYVNDGGKEGAADTTGNDGVEGMGRRRRSTLPNSLWT